MSEAGRYRICVVITSFTEGIINLVNSFSVKHDVDLVYIASPISRRDAQRLSPSCRIHAISYPYQAQTLAEFGTFQIIRSIRLFWNMFSGIRKVIKSRHPDIVHAHWAIPSGFLLALCKKSIPLVTTLLGSDILAFGKKLPFKYIIRYTLRRSAGIVAVSHELKNEAIKLGADPDKILVIPEGIDINRFQPVDKSLARSRLNLPDGFLVLYAGNLIKLKGVDKIIRAVSRLSRENYCRLLLLGDGPERVTLEELAAGLGLRNVNFAGRVPNEDMPLYLSAADVLVLLSESEGLPQCVQEALACATPVIASSVGGIPEIINHGENGYLASNEEELEGYLRKLMASPESAVVMGSNARRFAEQNLSSTKSIERTESLYASILNNRRAS